MNLFRWITSSICAALFLSACAGPSLPPAAQDGAGAPADQPTPSPADKWKLAYADNFAGGKPQLKWVPYPHFNQDNMQGGIDPTSPSGQEGIGILTNENAGGFATLSYIDAESPRDFRLETWLHTTVTQEVRGPLDGVAFRIDPVENRFYRFAARFAAEPSLSLAYVGEDVQNYPVSLGTWQGNDIPGGPPAASGWHKVVVEVLDNNAEVYWDSQKLSGGPFPLDRIPAGYTGVYGAMTGGLGLAEIRVSDFQVFLLDQ